MPQFGFPGLTPGDRWCLCAPRWREALEAGCAPRVVLRATHEGALDYCSLADLKHVALTSTIAPGARMPRKGTNLVARRRTERRSIHGQLSSLASTSLAQRGDGIYLERI